MSSQVFSIVGPTGNSLNINAPDNVQTTLELPASGKVAVAAAALVNNNLVKADGVAGAVKDAGYRIISGTTPTYGGGGTSNTFTVTGLTSAAKGTAVIRTSTNSVSITKALPGTDSLAITFSADPGAGTTVDYIYTTAAQT